MLIERNQETRLKKLGNGLSVKTITKNEKTTLTKDINKIEVDWLIKLHRKSEEKFILNDKGEKLEEKKESKDFVERNFNHELIKSLMSQKLNERGNNTNDSDEYLEPIVFDEEAEI